MGGSEYSSNENEVRTDFLGRKVIIAANRGKRPHDFKVSQYKKSVQPKDCFFCPGNESMTPPEIARLPKSESWEVRCFPNKFCAVSREFSHAYGSHEVVVETPDHAHTFSHVPAKNLEFMFEMFVMRKQELLKDPKIEYVSIFKNEGKEAGASLEHSHSQILAMAFKPHNIQVREPFTRYGDCAVCELVSRERERAVYEDSEVMAFCPYASKHPFEVWIIPKKHTPDLLDLKTTQLRGIINAMKGITSFYDNVLGFAPYNITYMCSSRSSRDFHFHIKFLPRIAIQAGFELGTFVNINIMPPEVAAPAIKEHCDKVISNVSNKD